MNTIEYLASVKVASPCNARWAEMDGDDRARFCALCQKHVYNLSAMTAEEAVALIREKEGKFCGRYFQRADSTMLTADCPVAIDRVRTRFRRMVGALAATVVLSWASIASAKAQQSGLQPRSRLALEVDKRVAQVKAWLYAKPPPAPAPLPWTGGMVMGGICPPPVTQNTNSTSLTCIDSEQN